MTAALVSVVMVVVASVFHAGIRTWGRGEGLAESHQQLRSLRYRLGLDLRNALPFHPIPVEGEEGRLRFVLAEPAKKGAPREMREILYQVESAGERARVVRTSISLLSGEEKKETLLEEFTRFQFFYPLLGKEGELVWQESWMGEDGSGKETLPRWVKVELVLEKDPTPWIQFFSLPNGLIEERSGEESL